MEKDKVTRSRKESIGGRVRVVSKGCSACEGQGWLVMFNTDKKLFEIQRCDTCGRFKSDLHARKRVAKNKDALIAALFAFCDAAMYEASRGCDRKVSTLPEMKALFKVIDGTLRDALALQTYRGTPRPS